MRAYIALIHKDAKSDYGVSFPDFPGCVTAGRTLDDARRLAAEALAFHVEGMLQDGDEIPEPSSLDAVTTSRKGVVAFLVDLPAELDRVARVNITLPQPLLRRIDAAADRIGETRSAYLATAARERLAGASAADTARAPQGTKRRAGR